MVIILQLCIFVVFAVWRGRFLFGWHLSPVRRGSNELGFEYELRGQRVARHIGLERRSGIPFVIRREQWYHREIKALGICSEISVGNGDFDERYFITTDFPGHLEQLLASRDLQEAVHELFGRGVKSLHATPRRIWCVLESGAIPGPTDRAATYLEVLGRISDATSVAVSRGSASPVSRKRRFAALAFIAVQAGLLTLGLFGLFPTYADSIHTVDTRALVTTGFAAGMLAAILWFFCILAVFRDSSWISWVLADFVLCGLLGFALTGISAVRDVNVQLTRASATVYQQPVVQKICTLKCKKGRRRFSQRSSYEFTSQQDCTPEARRATVALKAQQDPVCTARTWFEYTLLVRHWRGEGAYAFATEAPLFDSVRTGSLISLPIRQGAMGLDWMDWNEIGTTPP